MLSFTRWILAILTVVAAGGGGSLLDAPRLFAATSRDDAVGVVAASSAVAAHALTEIAFAKRQQPVGRRELLLRPVDIRLSPTSRFDAQRVASSADDPRDALAQHLHDATGPPRRS